MCGHGSSVEVVEEAQGGLQLLDSRALGQPSAFRGQGQTGLDGVPVLCRLVEYEPSARHGEGC